MASGDSRVWVLPPGAKAYVGASVVVHDAGGDKSEVETADGEKLQIPRSEILQREPLTPGEGVDQLTDLSFLHAPAIVDNLSERFQGQNGNKVRTQASPAATRFPRMPLSARAARVIAGGLHLLRQDLHRGQPVQVDA